MILKRSFGELKKDSRVLKECKTLMENGHQVSITIFGDNLSNNSEKLSNADVKIAKISDLTLFKHINPFSSQVYQYNRKNIFLKILDHLVLQIYHTIYNINTLHILLNENTDVYHAHDFETLLVGYISSSIKRKKLVYDSHELWTESRNFISSRGRIQKPFIFIMENFLIKKADKVITVNKSISDYLAQKYKIQNPVVVANFPEYSNVSKSRKLRDELSIDENKKIVLYQGAVFKGRGIEQLITCSKYLDDVVVVIMGDGYLKDKIRKRIEQEGYSNKVKMLDAVPHEVLIDYVSSADIGVAPVQNICLSYYFSLPNKVGEFIMAGIPFAVSNFPEMRRLAIDGKMGEVFDPRDPESMANAIKKVIDPDIYEQKIKNVLISKKQYSWEEESLKLIKLYNQIEVEI